MAQYSIKLKDYSNVQEEYVAAGDIYPGMLLEFTSAGKVQAHSSAGQNVAPIMFALEDALQGNDIDDAYSSSDEDVVQVWLPRSGDQVYAILADGEDMTKGDLLESNGAGYLQVHTADTADSDDTITVYPKQIVAQALETLDLSGSSGAETADDTLGYNKRIKVRIV
jgi:hypothetical protein